MLRAAVEIGYGELDAARAHIEAANETPRQDPQFGLYDSYVAESPSGSGAGPTPMR